jgi:hypothetical protein
MTGILTATVEPETCRVLKNRQVYRCLPVKAGFGRQQEARR